MIRINHVYAEEFGESDFFFDVEGDLVHYWHGNDATYRHEYMSPMLKKLGVEVREIQLTDTIRQKLQKELKARGWL